MLALCRFQERSRGSTPIGEGCGMKPRSERCHVLISFHLGEAEDGDVASEETGVEYLLANIEDIDEFVWLEPVRSHSAADNS